MNQISKRERRSFRVKWRWIALVLLFAVWFPQMRGCVIAFSPKVGRVVDVTTGQGIPKAAIIAAGRLGVEGRGGDGVYRVITYTDADGSYRVPGTWSYAWGETIPFLILERRWSPNVYWAITALKPGYAFVGDDNAWLRYNEKTGEPLYLPLSSVAKPEATWRGISVSVESMQLKPVQLSIKQAASYYRDIAFKISAAGGPSVSNKADDERLVKPVYDYLLPQVCGEDPDTKIDAHTAGALGDLAPNRDFDPRRGDKYMNKLRELEPDDFQTGYEFPVFKWDLYRMPPFAAGDVCLAMKAGG